MSTTRNSDSNLVLKWTYGSEYNTGMENDIVKVASYGNPSDADWARLLLEEQGIVSFLVGEYLGVTHYAHMDGGVKILVRRQDRERAEAVIAEFESQKRPDEPEPKTTYDLVKAIGLCVITWTCFLPSVLFLPVLLADLFLSRQFVLLLLYLFFGIICIAAVFFSAKLLVTTYGEVSRNKSSSRQTKTISNCDQ
jgi:hypothetical protein